LRIEEKIWRKELPPTNPEGIKKRGKKRKNFRTAIPEVAGQLGTLNQIKVRKEGRRGTRKKEGRQRPQEREEGFCRKLRRKTAVKLGVFDRH